MARPNGPIVAEVCSGLPLESEHLIKRLVPVYGLLDAPREWRKTVVKVFEGEINPGTMLVHQERSQN